MSLFKEEAKKLLNKMPKQKQFEVFQKLFEIRACDIDKAEEILNSIPEDIQRVIGLILLDYAEEASVDEKAKKLKEKDAEIRKDAITILNSLIAANPNESEDVLCDRALKMAQRLHDNC